MDKYYGNDFLSAFSIAFDDPFIPIETLVDSIFNDNDNNTLGEVYTKNVVAECLASALDELTDDEIDLFS